MTPLAKRFPSVAIPHDGESLLSIYRRTAAANCLTLHDVAPHMSNTTWIDPDKKAIKRVANDFKIATSDARKRTLVGKYPNIKTKPRSLWYLPGKYRLPCPSCGIHRPEYDFRFAYACTQCGALLRQPCNDIVTLPDNSLRIQQQLLRELRIFGDTPLNTQLHKYLHLEPVQV